MKSPASALDRPAPLHRPTPPVGPVASKWIVGAKQIRSVLACLLLAFILVVPASLRAQRGVTTAVSVGDLEKLAKAGDVESMLKLASYIFKNDMTDKFIDGIAYYQKAAAQGSATAEVSLGILAQTGKGLPQNDAEAAKWFRRAADHGDVFGKGYLGIAYVEGRGVPKDYAEAFKYLKPAADKNWAPAQYILGIMYSEGLGVSVDEAASLKLLEAAATQGERRALDQLTALRERMNFDQIKASAERGDVGAQFSMGNFYSREGKTQNFPEAKKWLLQAANKGHGEAAFYLASMALTGAGQAKDYPEAYRWFLASAQAGYSRGCTGLGIIYGNGFGVKQDFAEARTWLLKGAERGDNEAAIQLGLLAQNGVGGNRDLEEARRWFDRALQLGHPKAAGHLAQLAQSPSSGPGNPPPAATPRATVAANPEPAQSPTTLVLKGIAGSGSRRLALINNQNFAIGESSSMPLGPGAKMVKCIEIREKSVVISVEGVAGTQELFLKSD